MVLSSKVTKEGLLIPRTIPIDLIMFDFDGTIADSLPAAIEAIQAMLKELGYPFKTKEEIGRHIGFGEIPLVSGSIGTDDPEKIKIAQEIYYQYNLKFIEEVLLYPQVKDMLEYFKDKIKIVISNKRDEFIKRILENHEIDRYFAEILGGDSAPCLKPDPCAIIDVLKKHKISPDRALFIGDMIVDIETGKNAKVKTCAVTYGFHTRNQLKSADPDFLIDDLIELKQLIE